MIIIKQGKLPKPIHFVCQSCGARFIVFATEDCIDVVHKDTDKPMWACKCPTDGCRNICTTDFSEEDVKKWKDHLDIREIAVPALLPSSHIYGSPRTGGYTVCPHCHTRHSDHYVPHLKRSDIFYDAVVCNYCHRPFKVV